MSAAIEPFVQLRRVSFGDADPRGTLYFVSAARYCMDALEAWFIERLGVDWFHLTIERRIATPIVHSELDFQGAARPGETLSLQVQVTRLGNSSVGLLVCARTAQESRRCFECRMVCVFTDATTSRSIKFPDDLRSRLEQEAALTTPATST